MDAEVEAARPIPSWRSARSGADSRLSTSCGFWQRADASTEAGEIGALLRREALYSSHLTEWRKQRDKGALAALSRTRGRQRAHPLAVENETLRRRADRAEADLAKARNVIEVQGNVSALLGELLEPRSAKPAESSDT